jgi:hypothetical protein
MIPPLEAEVYLDPGHIGLIAALGGHGLFGMVACTSQQILQVSLVSAREALYDTAHCRRCRNHRSIRRGSHCRRCGVRLRSPLEWDLWSPQFQLRFCIEAFDILWQQANPPPPALAESEDSPSD